MWNVSYAPVIDRLIRQTGLFFFFAPGNHDTTTRPAGDPEREHGIRNVLNAMSKLMPPDGSPRRLAGYPTFSFGYGNSFFVLLDSDIATDERQLAWITRQLEGLDRSRYRHVFAVCTELMETLQSIPQPVIAQVHGVATAAGCQLVATCDLAVAAEEARFATPGVKIGLFCSTPMVAVSRAIGRKKAMEMLLTGDFISAQEALAAGLVNRVVPATDLDAATRALAEKIVAASPLVVGVGKQAFYRQLDMPQHQAYDYASEVMSFNATFADAQEGMCAFLQKRAPKWTGR